MAYRTTLSGQTFVFDDVKTVLARANEEKSGDILAGVGERPDTQKVDHKEGLNATRL